MLSFEARDGAQALALVGKQEFDVVLLDIMMPRLDGLPVCRALWKRNDVPVIFSPPCPMRRINCWAMSWQQMTSNIAKTSGGHPQLRGGAEGARRGRKTGQIY